MIRYICEPKHDHKHYGGVAMMDVDEKAMAYCLIEALFAAGRCSDKPAGTAY